MYEDSYPDYDVQLTLMTDWIICARRDIKKRKRHSVNSELENKKEKEQLDKDDQTRNIQDKLLVVEEYFRKKTTRMKLRLCIKKTVISDIKTNISTKLF